MAQAKTDNTARKHLRDEVRDLCFFARTPQDLFVDACRPLLKLGSADIGAFCVSHEDERLPYYWHPYHAPDSFLRDYERIAEHDFVRKAVAERPGKVVLDNDILSRRELIATPLYRDCRDLGVPLEHALAVLIPLRGGRHAGLTLYRDTDRPFTKTERQDIQMMVPFLAGGIQNCLDFAWIQAEKRALENDNGRSTEGKIQLVDGYMTACSPNARALMDAWYPEDGMRADGLPHQLAAALHGARASTAGPDCHAWYRLIDRGLYGHLDARPVDVLDYRGRPSARVHVHLREKLTMPKPWLEKLPTEQLREVARRVLDGMSNEDIARDLKLSLPRIKQLVKIVYDEIGAESRAKLISLRNDFDD